MKKSIVLVFAILTLCFYMYSFMQNMVSSSLMGNTYVEIQKKFAWSFEALRTGRWPVVDEDGHFIQNTGGIRGILPVFRTDEAGATALRTGW